MTKAFISSISKLIAEEQSIYGEISDEEWEALRNSKKQKQNEILRTMNVCNVELPPHLNK